MSKGIRTSLIILTALIVLVCIYCLSFTFKVNSIEKKAVALAEKAIPMENLEKRYPNDTLSQFQYEDSVHQNRTNLKNRYLDSISGEKVYLWHTYKACKEQQLNLGLDLQGGMSVVLQVSLKELIESLADKSKDPKFLRALNEAEEKMYTENSDYVTLFLKSYKSINPDGKLAQLFSTKNNKDDVTLESSDADVEKFIRAKSKEAFEITLKRLTTRIDQFGTKQPTITAEPARERISVEIAGVDNPARVRKLLQATANLEFWETYKATELGKYINDANTALKNYLDTQKDLGKDSLTENKIQNILTGDTNEDTSSSEINPLTGAKSYKKDTSQAGRFEEFRNENPLFAVLQPAVDENNQYQSSPIIGYVSTLDTAKLTGYLNLPEVKEVFPKEVQFLYSAKSFGEKQKFFYIYAIKKNTNSGKAPLDGSVVTQAKSDYDQNGQVVVSMQMNTLGAKTWSNLTNKNIGKSIAIVLDNQVYSAPNVNDRIDGGSSQISGGFDVQEATDLANVLKTGKLPASARIIEEEQIGASLGTSAIKAGLYSLLAAFLVIVGFMVFFYSSAGVVSIIVLLLNVFLIIGLMAGVGSTLTLPGIAGIVLTLGMAVDANVIIYERVKEELRAGKNNFTAVQEGFKHSLSAILDGNTTTFLTAVILAIIGIGPVKGFAITLIIGILTTLFTAVLLTKMIIDWRNEKGHELSYQTEFTKNFLQGYNFDFIGKRKITYTISSILIVIGIISFIFRGFEFGIDFKGGREYKVRFEKAVNTDDVRNSLNKVLDKKTVVKKFGAENQVKITSAFLITDSRKEVDSIVEKAVFNGLKTYLPNNTSYENFKRYNLMSSTKVDPTITGDFKRSSMWATIASLIVISLYIFLRFKRKGYSIGAIAATAHDAFMVLAIFSLFQGILPFAMEVDQIFIAALLTIIGYSINDTVIIFDRLREYLAARPNANMKDTMNAAINSTLSRTFNTAFTVFIVVFILFLFGGPVLKAFSFAMLLGVVIGIYSSVFIASPIMYDLDRDHDKYTNTATTTTKRKPINTKK